MQYFKDLLEKSTVDLISVILRDGVTNLAEKRYAISDWLDQWTENSRESAKIALDQCLANGSSRSKLYASPAGQSPRCYDVALTKSGDGSAAVSIARDVTAEMAVQDDFRRVAYHDGCCQSNRNSPPIGASVARLVIL